MRSRRLKTVATFDLFLPQQETVAQQVDGSVGLVQNPVALRVRQSWGFFRQQHVEQGEIQLRSAHRSSLADEAQPDRGRGACGLESNLIRRWLILPGRAGLGADENKWRCHYYSPGRRQRSLIYFWIGFPAKSGWTLPTKYSRHCRGTSVVATRSILAVRGRLWPN